MNQQIYLKRIGYDGILEPTIEVLKSLQKAHLMNIPFENLDIHYGNKIELDLGKIFQKVMNNSRGGFCYELNGLFGELLNSLGFQTRKISARVFGKEKGYGQEFDHLVTMVKIGKNEVLTDVGFGEFTFEPLRFELKTKQIDPRGHFFIDKMNSEYFRVNKQEDGEIIPQYIFKNIEREYHDFAEMCHYHQTHPSSHFTQKTLITLPKEDGRITLTGMILKIKKGNIQEEIELKTEADYKTALSDYFNVDLNQI